MCGHGPAPGLAKVAIPQGNIRYRPSKISPKSRRDAGSPPRIRKAPGSGQIHCLAPKSAVKILLYFLSETFDALVSRYPVVVAAVAATFIASALTLLGPLDHPSRMLDDLLIRHAPVSLPEPRVLIVEIPPEVIVAL